MAECNDPLHLFLAHKNEYGHSLFTPSNDDYVLQVVLVAPDNSTTTSPSILQRPEDVESNRVHATVVAGFHRTLIVASFRY